MTHQLDSIIQRLKSSPLFYLFLSSRELFHTNFWFWLCTINPEETLKLFTDNTSSGEKLTFKREHNQKYDDDKSKVDLLIYAGNKPIVAIENKVKDFPTLRQLERIKSSFNNEIIEYVLVTLFFLPDISFEGWRIKTYQNISNDISPANFTDNSYHRNLIQDYKELIYNLSELAASLPVTSDYDFVNSFDTELYEKLDEIKLWESYQKLRASHLLHHFGIRDGIETRYGIYNRKATIDFYVQLKNGYEVGIQIEGVQYRKFVIGKNAEVFAQNLLSNGIFFSDDFKGRGNRPFLKYEGKVSFRYQYKKIAQPTSYATLFDEICHELTKVKQQMSAIESSTPNS